MRFRILSKPIIESFSNSTSFFSENFIFLNLSLKDNKIVFKNNQSYEVIKKSLFHDSKFTCNRLNNLQRIILNAKLDFNSYLFTILLSLLIWVLIVSSVSIDEKLSMKAF